MKNDAQEQYDMIEYGDNRVYIPTIPEQKLLAVLLNPEHVSVTLREKIILADVSYTTYYKAMGKPQFREMYRELMLDELQAKAPKVMQKMYDYAISEPRNSTERMNILKLLKIADDKVFVDITKKNLNVNMNIDNTDSMATEDIKEMIKSMIREDPTLIEGIKLDEKEEK